MNGEYPTTARKTRIVYLEEFALENYGYTYLEPSYQTMRLSALYVFGRSRIQNQGPVILRG
jgi:hypothetical protein